MRPVSSGKQPAVTMERVGMNWTILIYSNGIHTALSTANGDTCTLIESAIEFQLQWPNNLVHRLARNLKRLNQFSDHLLLTWIVVPTISFRRRRPSGDQFSVLSLWRIIWNPILEALKQRLDSTKPFINGYDQDLPLRRFHFPHPALASTHTFDPKKTEMSWLSSNTFQFGPEVPSFGTIAFHMQMPIETIKVKCGP